MSNDEIKQMFNKADRKTKEIVFAFLVETIDSDSRNHLARFLALLS